MNCCSNINITLQQNMPLKKRNLAGEFKKESDLINGRNYWTSKDEKTSIWFHKLNNEWFIGPIKTNEKKNIKGFSCESCIVSHAGPFCPTKQGMKWEYFIFNSGAWNTISDNSFEIECINDDPGTVPGNTPGTVPGTIPGTVSRTVPCEWTDWTKCNCDYGTRTRRKQLSSEDEKIGEKHAFKK